MEAGTRLDLSCSRAGVKPQTVRYWKGVRPLIDRYILKLKDINKDKRDDSVEQET